MSLSLIALLAVATPVDPDAVVTTAQPGRGAAPVVAESVPSAVVVEPPASPDMTTDEQIALWLAQRPDGDARFPEAPADGRAVHGEAFVGVGTGGYRAWGGAVSMPLGSDGRLELRFQDVDNDPWSLSRRVRYGYGAPDAWSAEADGSGHALPAPRRHRGMD